MTTETMNVHLALVELKTLDKRIASAISSGRWVVANKHSNTKINGVDVKEFEAEIESRYQKVWDLIKRRDAIKRAVVNSNAVTRVEVAGVTYTVAEAIDMKNNGLTMLRTFRDRLVGDYDMAKRTVMLGNSEDLESRADKYVTSLLGNTDVKGMSAEIDRMRKEFIAAQTMELVDPIEILKKIEALEEQINSFATNVDAALSVSNALTTITIEY